MGPTHASSFHESSLTARVRRALRAVAPFACHHGFYLAGGTAVALHLGHRRSIDLDWFRVEPLPDPLQLAHSLIDHLDSAAIIQVAEGTLALHVMGTRVSFFEYRYPLLRPLLFWADYHCWLASLEDLACMKLLAIAQRGTKRDFVDMYAISQIVPLSHAIELYKQKYGIQDITHLLRALTYFDDADRERMPALRQPMRWRQIKQALIAAVRQMT